MTMVFVVRPPGIATIPLTGVSPFQRGPHLRAGCGGRPDGRLPNPSRALAFRVLAASEAGVVHVGVGPLAGHRDLVGVFGNLGVTGCHGNHQTEAADCGVDDRAVA